MINLLIINNKSYCHLEIIESIIVNYHEVIKLKIPPSYIQLFLILKEDCDESFIRYIKYKYPKIQFTSPKFIDYTININFYPSDKYFKRLENSNPKFNFFISHRVFKDHEQHPNVLFLTPLSKTKHISCPILPFTNEKKILTDVPIFVIQGSFSHLRRDYNLLKYILRTKFDYDYKIKLIGKGDIPPIVKYNKDKFIVCNNCNFIDFHKEFRDCFAILTLLSRKRNKKYYRNSLTSTINYARGYKLKCIIDSQLQSIYKLPDVQIYQKTKDITVAFEKCLKYFYNKKEKRNKELLL